MAQKWYIDLLIYSNVLTGPKKRTIIVLVINNENLNRIVVVRTK